MVVALCLFIGPSVFAGVYADTLGKCMVDATTPAEKRTLVRSIFAMIALHPEVESGSAITPEQRTALAKQMAELFQRLLTEACQKEARDAIRYEGMSTVQSSFLKDKSFVCNFSAFRGEVFNKLNAEG